MSETREIRTRFAPSPSGFLHVGGARTALFNYLFARSRRGKFIIRVEDTDRERSTAESERLILDSLNWLGIHPDEGPDEGGDFGPYRQSERLEIYARYTEKLLREDKAYPCFCTPEELESRLKRSEESGDSRIYDGACSALTPAQREKRIASGEKYCVRLRVDRGEIAYRDLIQEYMQFDGSLIGDFIIVKSDGYPSYNYAVVIDDHEMKISHVIRGVGHLSNTPKQIAVHRALDLPLPAYAHISEIVGTDKKKLSKRRGAASVLFFRDLGYLSEAFVNYMALLGWYPEDGQEFMPDGALAERFDLHRCSRSPAMFDFFLSEKGGEDFDPTTLTPGELAGLINGKSKLRWLNNKYIRHLPLEEVWEAGRPYIEKHDHLKSLYRDDPDRIRHTFDRLRVYLHSLQDVVPYMEAIFQDNPLLEDDAREHLQIEIAPAVIDSFRELLAEQKPETPDEYQSIIKDVGGRTGAKGKNLFMTIRCVTTGSMHGLELPSLFSLLGYEKVLERVAGIQSQIR